MKTLVAFDFDGTLYPIAPYDSEQLLMLISNRKNARYEEAVEIVRRDQEGLLGHENFSRAYDSLARGASRQDMKMVIDELEGKVDRAEYQAFRQLARKADLVTISCGTADLAISFLERLGIRDCFRAFHGKEFIYEGDIVTKILFPVDTFEAKAAIVEKYYEEYDRIIAVGDGPTDIPMLKRADKGIIVDLVGKNPDYPFECVHSIAELLESLDPLF